MISWWAWLLLWSGIVIGGLLVIAYFIFFMVRKGLGVVRQLSHFFEKAAEVSDIGVGDAQTPNSSPLSVAQAAAGVVQNPWVDYYAGYRHGKKFRQGRRRQARILAKKRAGRPQTLKDIDAAKRHAEEVS